MNCIIMMLFNSSIFNFLTKNGKVSLPGEAKLMKAFKITAFLVYKNLGLSNLGYERNEINYEMDSHLWHRCLLVNFVKFLRTSFLQNTSGRLLLYLWVSLTAVFTKECMLWLLLWMIGKLKKWYWLTFTCWKSII